MFNYLKNLFSKSLSEKESYIYAQLGRIALWLSPILLVILSTVYSFNHSGVLRLLVLFCGATFIFLFLLYLFFEIRYKHKK